MSKKGLSMVTCGLKSKTAENFKIKDIRDKSNNTVMINELLKEWMVDQYPVEEYSVKDGDEIVGFYVESKLKDRVAKQLVTVVKKYLKEQ